QVDGAVEGEIVSALDAEIVGDGDVVADRARAAARGDRAAVHRDGGRAGGGDVTEGERAGIDLSDARIGVRARERKRAGAEFSQADHAGDRAGDRGVERTGVDVSVGDKCQRVT